MMYRNISKKSGNARIAFILGHELAHVAHGDTLPKSFVPGTSAYRKALQEFEGDKGREKERKADEEGFVYAAMAGYTVDKLLEEKNGGHFFRTWQAITHADCQLKKTHPSCEQRAQSLYARLKRLLDNLHYFHFGVRLAHFDECQEGEVFLGKFLKVFPSREVYNNLGFCYLQEARKKLGNVAYLYWLPSMLDVDTRIDAFRLPSTKRGEADDFLEKAKNSFKLASDSDPFYVPVHINLAVTLLYQGKLNEAYVAIKNASRLVPNNLEVQSLRALIEYEKDDRTQQETIQKLRRLTTHRNAPLSIFYNIAQLVEKGQNRRDDRMWRYLAQHITELPISIRHVVCEKQKNCPKKHNPFPKSRWHLPVEPETLVSSGSATLNTLKQWKRLRKRQLYQHPEGLAEVLVLNGRVKMVVLKELENVAVSHLDNYCEASLHQRIIVNGLLKSCNDRWAAWVVDDKVKEVWVVKRAD